VAKVIIIVGPTASGKSALAVELAKQFDGEVVSADSRQVYRGLDIGTNKLPVPLRQGVPHYLIDVESPERTFTAARYKKLATRAVKQILQQRKVPIICGGTGFYIDALLGEAELSPVLPNLALRRALSRLPVRELYEHLVELDPKRAKVIDGENPQRLIRAIEIASSLEGLNPKRLEKPKWKITKIGLRPPSATLRDNIKESVKQRLRQGLIGEVKGLRKGGLSWKRLEELGLEYRIVARLLEARGKNSALRRAELEKLTTELEMTTWHYAKRQLTWFKRDKQIKWYTSPDEAMEKLRKI